MSNPVFTNTLAHAPRARSVAVMTPSGTIAKSFVLFIILCISALLCGQNMLQNAEAGVVFGLPVMGALIGGVVLGLIAVLVGCFVPRLAALAGLVYAVVEGAVIGIVSVFYGSQEGMHDLPLLAAAMTMATLFGMLILYQTRIIRVTALFRKIVIGATVGLVLGIVGLWLLSFIGVGAGLSGTLFGNGPIGIGFSVFIVGLAAFNLALDFDFIERGSQQGLPKHYEWVAALGLMVTLAWLYLEFLRLLSKLRSE